MELTVCIVGRRLRVKAFTSPPECMNAGKPLRHSACLGLADHVLTRQSEDPTQLGSYDAYSSPSIPPVFSLRFSSPSSLKTCQSWYPLSRASSWYNFCLQQNLGTVLTSPNMPESRRDAS